MMQPLTKQEFKVLDYLRRADGIPIHPRELAQFVKSSEETLRNHALRNLRKKLKPEFEILHRRCIGYTIKQHLPIEGEIPLVASGR